MQKLLFFTHFAVILIFLQCTPSNAQDKENPTLSAKAQSSSWRQYLPLSLRSATTWIVLQETQIKPLPDKTPLEEILNTIKKGLKENTKGHAINLIIENSSLSALEISLTSPIRSPFVGSEPLSVYSYMELLFGQMSLYCTVRDNIVIISSGCSDCSSPKAVTLEEAKTWLLLREKITLDFPKEVSLSNFLTLIRDTVANIGSNRRGLLFMVEESGFKEDKKSLQFPLQSGLIEVEVCTYLRFVLGHFGLQFYVREDGIVVITDDESLDDTSVNLLSMDDSDTSQQLSDLMFRLKDYQRRDSQNFKGKGFGPKPKKP
ncbi:hypothetical protein [Singulisphaera sp. PoT]|uniref:hypothetical protein n=1 Tax=Singulisphaera sp. PoT TaxID=3411797 RepID=UPI003BF4D405